MVRAVDIFRCEAVALSLVVLVKEDELGQGIELPKELIDPSHDSHLVAFYLEADIIPHLCEFVDPALLLDSETTERRTTRLVVCPAPLAVMPVCGRMVGLTRFSRVRHVLLLL